MKTAHYAIDCITGNLVFLGVGADDEETANALSDAREAHSALKGERLELGDPILNVDDLYKLITQATAALNHLPTEELVKS